MASLRLMTLNVQLPPLSRVGEDDPDNLAVAGAELVVETLQGLPMRDRPDVIAFNGVFAGGARASLVQGLSARGTVVPSLFDPPAAESGVGSDAAHLSMLRHSQLGEQ
jgi:hypothetical protein